MTSGFSDAWLERIHTLAAPLAVDPLPMLRARPRTEQLDARRVVRALDGWIAVNLARPDDVASVPAWLELDHDFDDPWPAIESAAAARPATLLVERAALLGMPVSSLGEVAAPAPSALAGLPVLGSQLADAPRLDRAPLVVNLASLWAGPLCARLLADRGAHVVKVESVARPDAARISGDGLFVALNAGAELRTLALDTNAGCQALRELLHHADVVIEGSRPRALQQLGIDAATIIAADGQRVWVSITGYGRASDRVAFGDDAAFAGGLAVGSNGGPAFAGVAAADPLAGITAASATVSALARGGRWLIDVALASVAAFVAAEPSL